MLKNFLFNLLAMTILIVPAYAVETELPQNFKGFNLEGYEQDGQKAWDVKGDTADIKGNTILLTNIDANRYGNQEVNLKAKSGIVDKASGNIHLERDVIITAKSGVKLTTDTLDWQKGKDLVSTDDKVFIKHEKMDATGTGLRAQPGLKLAQLNSNVTVKMNTEAAEKIPQILTITCDGPMEIDQLKNMAVFNKNVVAVQIGRELKADRMEIYFDPQGKQIKEIICIGKVIITQGENKTFADKAVYNALEKKMTLSGRPKLIMITEGEGSIGFGDMMKSDKKEEPKDTR